MDLGPPLWKRHHQRRCGSDRPGRFGAEVRRWSRGVGARAGADPRAKGAIRNSTSGAAFHPHPAAELSIGCDRGAALGSSALGRGLCRSFIVDGVPAGAAGHRADGGNAGAGLGNFRVREQPAELRGANRSGIARDRTAGRFPLRHNEQLPRIRCPVPALLRSSQLLRGGTPTGEAASGVIISVVRASCLREGERRAVRAGAAAHDQA